MEVTMKYLKYILAILLISSPLLSKENILKPLMPWTEGMYVEYYKEWKSGNRDSYRIFLLERDKNSNWITSVTVKNSGYEVNLIFKIKTNLKKNEISIELIGDKVIRGKVPPNHYSTLYAYFLNVFHRRQYYTEELKKSGNVNLKINKIDYPFGMNTVATYNDVWDEFGYTQYHDFNYKIPITGLAGTRTSDNRFTMRVVAFGCFTYDFENYKTQPTYIDFYNLKKIEYPDYKISIPASWHIEKINMKKEGICKFGTIYYNRFTLGGNTHSGYLEIKFSNSKKFDQRKNELPDFENVYGWKFKFNKMTSFRAKNKGKGSLFFYDYLHRYQMGRKIIGIVKYKDRMAEIAIFINFDKNNPHKKNIATYEKQMGKIIKSIKLK